jgi:hypothetical protein
MIAKEIRLIIKIKDKYYYTACVKQNKNGTLIAYHSGTHLHTTKHKDGSIWITFNDDIIEKIKPRLPKLWSVIRKTAGMKTEGLKGIEMLSGTYGNGKEIRNETIKPDDIIVDLEKLNYSEYNVIIYLLEPENYAALNFVHMKMFEYHLEVFKGTNPWVVFQIINPTKRKEN